MDTVRDGFQAIRELQDYVDAQAGGPGKGFFQIVTNPYEARRVINQGRMAVVLEIEISEPFDCRASTTPTCDQGAGRRSGWTSCTTWACARRCCSTSSTTRSPGVRFDGGPVGVAHQRRQPREPGLVLERRRRARARCTDNDDRLDRHARGQRDLVDAAARRVGVPGGTAPAYPPAPHCNTRGLTDLGRHVVERMMDRT